jgi:hypothetical protein
MPTRNRKLSASREATSMATDAPPPVDAPTTKNDVKQNVEVISYTLDGTTVISQRQTMPDPDAPLGVTQRWAFSVSQIMAQNGISNGIPGTTYPDVYCDTEEERDEMGRELAASVKEIRDEMQAAQASYVDKFAAKLPKQADASS